MVSRELLDEFKIICKEEFNVNITDEEATEMSTELVNLMKVLLKPESDPEITTNSEDMEERRSNETGTVLKP